MSFTMGQTTCSEPHYRWSEKIDASLATKTPIVVDVSDILSSWARDPSLEPTNARSAWGGRRTSMR